MQSKLSLVISLVGLVTIGHAMSLSPINVMMANYMSSDCSGGYWSTIVQQEECLQVGGEGTASSPMTATLYCNPEPVPCAEIGYYADSSCQTQQSTKKVVLGNCQGPVFSEEEGLNYQFLFDTQNSLTINTNCSNNSCTACSNSATLASGQCQTVNGKNMMLLSQDSCVATQLWVFPDSSNCMTRPWIFSYPNGECADGNGNAFSCEAFSSAPEFHRESKSNPEEKRLETVGGVKRRAGTTKKEIHFQRRSSPIN